jgi:uncharacterized protein
VGFLRIEKGDNLLDNTIIHPESYPIVEELLRLNGSKLQDIIGENNIHSNTIVTLKEKYSRFFVDFIVKEMQRPTVDPREPLEQINYNGVDTIEELKEGMRLKGIINNVTNFGAFVNIGIKESGLVHVSELSNTFVSSVKDFVRLNQQVNVKVISVDLIRKQVQLTMK